MMSLLTISSSSLLMSSLRLIGTRLGGWTTAGILGSSTMWYSPFNFPTPLKHSGYRLIRSCLSLMGCSLETVLSRGVGTLSSIERLSVCSFRWVDVGRPIIAGPGVSVT